MNDIKLSKSSLWLNKIEIDFLSSDIFCQKLIIIQRSVNSDISVLFHKYQSARHHSDLAGDRSDRMDYMVTLNYIYMMDLSI